MSIYYEKARELGNIMLLSEAGVRMTNARETFNNDTEAVNMFNAFMAYQDNVNASMKSGVMTKEQYTKASQIVLEKSDELKAHPIIGELVNAENDFYEFVNNVLGVVKSTITGEIIEQSSGGCSSGGCSSGGCSSGGCGSK